MLPPFCRTKKNGGDHRLILELLNGIKMIQGRRYTLQVSVSNPPMELIQNQRWPPGWTMPKLFPPSRSLRKGEFVGKILQNRVYRECIGNILSRWWLALFGWNFHPENWGRGTHCDEHIFQRGLVQPPTSYITILEPENAWVSKFGKFKGLIFRRSIPGTSGVHEPFV